MSEKLKQTYSVESNLATYDIYLRELHHQDNQLWQVNILYFSVHAGLFAAFTFFLTSGTVYFKVMSFIITFVGMFMCFVWYIGAKRISDYTRKRLTRLKKIERELTKIKLWSKEHVKGLSVKPIYTTLIPSTVFLGWFMGFFFFIFSCFIF